MVAGNGISISGLGSGLDTASLIQKLVQLESQRKVQLQAQQTAAQSKLDSFGTLKALVATLRDKADGLSLSSKFLQLKGTASREGVIGFDVTSAAQQGSHTITVQQLAATDRWAFDGVADATTNLATTPGEVTFSVGGTDYSVAIDAASSSLDGIASAINAEAGAAVDATVVNVGTESSPSWKLVLASQTTGVDGRIHGLSSSVTGLNIDGTEPAPDSNTPVSANQIVVGQNAKALVDGLQVERSSNEFSGVLAGVTFTAQSADPLNPVQLTISSDGEAIQTAVQDFVDAYNAVVNFANKQNTYSKDGGAGGVLFGDSSMSLVTATLRTSLFNVPTATVEADTEGYSTLGLVGLNLQNDGTIVIDATKLSSKIADNVTELANLFADDDGFDDGGAQPGDPGYGVDQTTDSGLAASLTRALDLLTEPGVGAGGIDLKSIFGAKDDALRNQISTLDKRIADEDFRLGKFEEELQARFANLEAVMGQLNSQTAALQALFNNNPK
jgi:flagellar hook-associated protein 2